MRCKVHLHTDCAVAYLSSYLLQHQVSGNSFALIATETVCPHGSPSKMAAPHETNSNVKKFTLRRKWLGRITSWSFLRSQSHNGQEIAYRRSLNVEEDFSSSTSLPLHGIRSLPPELLCDIFQLYVDAFSQRAPPVDYQSLVAAYKSPYCWIRVTHVCQHWRDVALAMPHLWSSVVVTHEKKLVKITRKMLLRSGNAPLHLYLYSIPSRPLLFDVFGSSVERLESIEVYPLYTFFKIAEGARFIREAT